MTRPGQRVEMDDWNVELQLLMEKSGTWRDLSPAMSDAVVRQRCWLSVIIDCATRVILAMRLVSTVSTDNAVATLEMATVDKKTYADTVGALKPMRLPGDLAKVERIMARMAEIADLALDVEEGELVPRLLHAAGRELGTAMEICHDAIEKALNDPANAPGEAGPGLTRLPFANACAARTGCDLATNPFLAPAWGDIDCTKLLAKGPDA